MYAGNELLFPAYAIAHLRDVRGPKWRTLVERVLRLEEDHPEALAFSLMMMKLDGCRTCETDSFRAMRGCVACAQQTVRRYKGSDGDLLKLYDEALTEVKAYLTEQRRRKTRSAVSVTGWPVITHKSV